MWMPVPTTLAGVERLCADLGVDPADRKVSVISFFIAHTYFSRFPARFLNLQTARRTSTLIVVRFSLARAVTDINRTDLSGRIC